MQQFQELLNIYPVQLLSPSMINHASYENKYMYVSDKFGKNLGSHHTRDFEGGSITFSCAQSLTRGHGN
jgi:hypothetical protein